MSVVSIQNDLTRDDVVRLSASGIAGIDTETTGLDPRRDLLCLVQICDPQGEITIIRTRDWLSAERLRDFLLLPGITKVMHYALFDCSFLQKNLGIEIQDVYCTRTASKLARTYSSNHSLVHVVGELLGVSLDKSQQTTYWCDDKLNDEQIAYAAADVQYLLPLREKLEVMLQSKGLLPSGISYVELNERCQKIIPTLVHLTLNGWETPRDQPGWIF